jgi:CRISPR/Cas system endoribonuclease Cas6 (RAMP superfamily)
MADGKPLRKPRFSQVFPFMLRRVTSMLFAHSGVELVDDPSNLLESVGRIEETETLLSWNDWRTIAGQPGLVVGGFTGEMVLSGQAIEDIFWVLAAASLFGIGKGATYGAGRFRLCH